MPHEHRKGKHAPLPRFCSLYSTLLLAVLALALSMSVPATSWETTSLRATGGGLVRPGMTRAEVLQTLGLTDTPARTQRSTATGRPTSGRNKTITYRGEDGLYSIHFSGDRVDRILVTPRRD